jgi:topoisomerase-4 subunit A
MMNAMVEHSDQMSAIEYTSGAYLNYSLYVIRERALPSVADGLKPVQRRIIFAMNELHLDFKSKYKKSARSVGDVLGKYHPHGDSACYEAMVNMAQPFNTLHALIDGQGNWGSLDEPKSFAAMRYTESKLTRYSALFFRDIKKDTVDWRPNFDGSLEEPITLPVEVPNILINGATGIAVGMSTDIPPHNLKDIISATQYLLKHPNASSLTLGNIVKAPDFPTGGVIVSTEANLQSIYETGRGKVIHRAKYHIEDDQIIVTEVPYKKSVSKIVEQIHILATAKGVSILKGLDDESDSENPVRIAITPKGKGVNPEALMELLFEKTDLQDSYRISMNMLGLDKQPGVRSLKSTLSEWLVYRRDVLTRRTKFELNSVQARLHILEGLLIAYLNIDEVIDVIRTSDDARADLMSKLGLTDIQAKAVLEIKLRQLAKLEEFQLKSEQDELLKEESRLKELLSNPKKMNELISTGLSDAKKIHGIPRKTEIDNITKKVESLSLLKAVKVEPVTILLSKKGWLSSLKGHSLDQSCVQYKSGDKAFISIESESDKSLVILSKLGKTFSLSCADIIAANSAGFPITSKISFDKGDAVLDLFPESDSSILIYNDKGYGFVSPVSEMSTRQTKGKAVVSTKGGDTILPPVNVDDKNWVGVLTYQNRLLVYPLSEVSVSTKARGVKLISLKDEEIASGDDGIVSVFVFGDDDTIIIKGAQKHTLKPDDWSGYQMARARRGKQVERKTTRALSVTIK